MTILPIDLDSVNKACLIGIWIETVLYGINCVMYAHCMSILIHKRKATAMRWVLFGITTVLFLLCTAHVGQSLQQLLDVFIYAPDNDPDYSLKYWSDFSLPPRVAKDVLFCTLILSQNSIQIWRLYVVFMYDWRVALVPSVLLLASVGSAYAAAVISALPLDSFYGTIINNLLVVACTLEVTVNVFVTIAIVLRLWWMGRQTASLRVNQTHPFASSIYIVIESGAIWVLLSTMFLAFATYSVALALIGLDVLAQLDVLIPLLIIVQVAQTERHRSRSSSPSETNLTSRYKIMFQPRIPVSRDFQENILLQNVQCHSSTIGPEARV